MWTEIRTFASSLFLWRLEAWGLRPIQFHQQWQFRILGARMVVFSQDGNSG